MCLKFVMVVFKSQMQRSSLPSRMAVLYVALGFMMIAVMGPNSTVIEARLVELNPMNAPIYKDSSFGTMWKESSINIAKIPAVVRVNF